MVNLSGLSAAYPGFQRARGADLDIRAKELGVGDMENSQAGDVAFGNTLKMFQQQVPGAQPMPGGMPPGAAPQPMAQNGPMPPQPGQPSVPMSPPGQSAMSGGPAPPQQAQPQMPQPAPPPMQGGGGMPQQQPAPQPGQTGHGMLDWRAIAQKVAQANLGAPPQVIAAAVTKFLPLMNQQAQMEWKNVMMAQQVARTGIQQQRADTAADQGDRRLDNAEAEGARRKEQGDRRLGQGDERIEVSKEEAARRKAQGDRRGDQADTRIGQRDTQLAREGEREKRLTASAAIRQDQGYQRLEQQKKAFEQRVVQGNDRQALTQWRAILDAQHKLAQEKIQASNFGNTMDAKDKKALLAEQDAFYRSEIARMKNGGAKKYNPDTGKIE